eukprot:362380-Chlamydomonas_euryale.AAC.3
MPHPPPPPVQRHACHLPFNKVNRGSMQQQRTMRPSGSPPPPMDKLRPRAENPAGGNARPHKENKITDDVVHGCGRSTSDKSRAGAVAAVGILAVRNVQCLACNDFATQAAQQSQC